MTANTSPMFSATPGDGLVTTDFSGGTDVGRSVAVQSDGKIVVAGSSGYDFALARYNPDGSLDASFGAGGKVVTDFGSDDRGQSVVLLPDGGILVGGSSWNGSQWDFSLARYHQDGSPDTGFNGDGLALSGLGGYDFSMARQADGSIILVGEYNANFALVRLDAQGNPDAGFGTGGMVVTDLGGYDSIKGVALQADGSILVTGIRTNLAASTSDLVLARYTSAGALDTGFGDSDGGGGHTGTAIIDLPLSAMDVGYSVTTRAAGGILVAGESHNSVTLLAFLADGTPDTGFGSNGVASFPAAGSGRSVHELADGKILVAGYEGNDFVLVRYTATGVLDTSFGQAGSGSVVTDFGGGADAGYSLAVQPDGRIIVAGGSGDDFALARYNSDGSPDASFDTLTTLDGTAAYTENGPAVALDGGVAVFDGELSLLNGGTGNFDGASVTLARHGGANAQDSFTGSGNLSLDGGNAVLSGTPIGTVANGGGTLTITFNGNATQAAVNEALSSIAYANGSDTPPASVRIDWTFSDGNAGAQGSGGAGVVTGGTTVNITAANDAPALTGSAATLDTGSEDIAYTVAKAQLLTGWTDIEGDTLSIAGLTADHGAVADNGDGTWTVTPAANYNGPMTLSYGVSDGADTTSATLGYSVNPVNDAPGFGLPGNGKVITNLLVSDGAYGVALQSDGKLVVAGGVNAPSRVSIGDIKPGIGKDIGLVRYNSDGSLDTTFDSDGKVITDFGGFERGHALAVLPGGGIVVAGSKDGDFALVRYNPDGSLDSGFGNGGLITTDFGGNDAGYSLAVQPDGKLVIAGTSNGDLAVVRYNPDGGLDTSFDVDGKITIAGFSPGYDVKAQPDGKLVVAGKFLFYEVPQSYSGVYDLARFTPDGSLDTGFGGVGWVATGPVGSSFRNSNVAVQPDGKLIVAGYDSNHVARYNSDGSLDSSLNGDGRLQTPDTIANMVVQPDGKIVCACFLPLASYLVRYNNDGSLDSGFGTGGRTATFPEASFSLMLQPDGKLVVVGSTLQNGVDFFLARYNADGSIDTTIGSLGGLSGTVTYPESGAAVVLDGDVDLRDADLDAANNYQGATLTLARQGGANPQDVFEGVGTLSLNPDGSVVVDGTGVGNYTQTGGTLVITFNAAATSALADRVAQQIAYHGTAHAPGTLQIQWTFNDGNTGTQGTGGALSAVGSAYVHVVCFLRGTRILTRAGYVPVEELRLGDEVQTLAHGWRPVVWLGVRHVPRNAAGRFDHAVQPIRIVRDAFGAGLPRRDLWVSPDHAVFFRGHLIPAKALVNGETVIREPEPESITYYHVLLDRHAVVFSDGLPTESYCPQENLDGFENLADCPAEWRSDLAAPIGLLTDCHPRTATGPVVETARAFLARRAGMGFSPRCGAAVAG